MIRVIAYDAELDIPEARVAPSDDGARSQPSREDTSNVEDSVVLRPLD